MYAWCSRPALSMLAVAFVASIVSLSPVRAQQLTAQQFQANPGQMLTANPNGGVQLTSLIRQLALTDPADLPVIVSLLANANPDQAASIGAGLGQAALASVRTNQPYAAQIQQALATANNEAANTAYAAVTANLPIGGVGGGGGAGSAGGVGGQTNPLGGFAGIGGAVEGIGNNGTNTGAFSATGSAAAAGSVTTTGTGTTRTITLSVSVSP